MKIILIDNYDSFTFNLYHYLSSFSKVDVFRNDIGYAKYIFTFTSKIPEYLGKKVVVSGISFFRFKLNSIVEYSESVNGGIAMVQLGVKPEKMQKVFLKWFKRSLEDDLKLRNFYESKNSDQNK